MIETHKTHVTADRQPLRRWWHAAGVLLFLFGSAYCLYWLSVRSWQDIKFSAWYLTSSETGAVKKVDCPPSIARDQTGTVTAKVYSPTTEDRTVYFYLDDPVADPSRYYRDQIACKRIVPPSEQRYTSVSCQIDTSGMQGDWFVVMADVGQQAYFKLPTMGCSIWISPVPDYGGATGLLILFAPGLFGMAIGGLLWFGRWTPLGCADWSLVVLGALVALWVLMGIALVIGAEGAALIALSLGALFWITLSVSLFVFRMRSRQ